MLISPGVWHKYEYNFRANGIFQLDFKGMSIISQTNRGFEFDFKDCLL